MIKHNYATAYMVQIHIYTSTLEFKYMNKIKIEKISNGYILTDYYEDEDGKIIEEKETIEILDDDHDAMKRLIVRVAECFGYNYDKWGKENLEISFFGKRHKFEE